MAFVSLLLQNCQNNKVNSEESVIAGNIQVSADESLQPVVASQIDAFKNIYPKANISELYKPQAKAVEDLLNNEARVIFVARQLSEEEQRILTTEKSGMFVVPAASDAIAILLNKNNRDTVFKFSQLEQILRGEILTWKNINPKNNLGAINIVFDNPMSSTVTEMLQRIQRKELPKNSYATQKNTDVIGYVAQHENAIGIVGSSWVSDLGRNDKNVLNQKIVIAALSHPDSLNNKFYRPLQGNLLDGTYPLARKIYMISRQAGGLGSGLMTFVGSDKGQRIFLKAGLAPQQLPGRTISVKQ